MRGRSGGLNPVFRKMGFFGFGWLWDKGNGRIQGVFWVRWKHFVSSWRWVSAKKLPLGVSLWGKSVYTSFCVEQGLTLKGLPSSRDATAFFSFGRRVEEKKIVGHSLLPTTLRVSSPPDKKHLRKRLLRQAGWSPVACACTRALVRLEYGGFGLVL